MTRGIQCLSGLVFLCFLLACDNPWQQLAKEKQEAFEKISIHTFIIAKEQAELLNQRPLNSVEEREIQQFADSAAKEEVDKSFYDREQSLAKTLPSNATATQPATTQAPTKAEQADLIKHDILGEDKDGRPYRVVSCELEHVGFLKKATTPKDILNQSKWMLEDSIKKEKIRKRDCWSLKNVPLRNRAMVRRYDASLSREDKKAMDDSYVTNIKGKEEILARVITLINTK